MKKYSFIILSLCFLPLSGVIPVNQGTLHGGENANTLETANRSAKFSFVLKNDHTRYEDMDHGFLSILSAAGINSACNEMDIDFDEVFAPMAARVNHPYRQYRWSVSRDEHGNPVIHALPPEAEMGWTPWERWSVKYNIPVRTAWVLYPVKEPVKKGIAKWYTLEESENLMPRLLHKTEDMDTILRLARIDVAADWLGLDFKTVFVDSLTTKAQKIYARYRWVLIPHILANDRPVIYALPPMDKSDDWPWESWYSDGITPVIHHVHYTQEKLNTTGIWTEGPVAPQRPSEIFGHTWYWYDDPEMIPALAKYD